MITPESQSQSQWAVDQWGAWSYHSCHLVVVLFPTKCRYCLIFTSFPLFWNLTSQEGIQMHVYVDMSFSDSNGWSKDYTPPFHSVIFQLVVAPSWLSSCLYESVCCDWTINPVINGWYLSVWTVLLNTWKQKQDYIASFFISLVILLFNYFYENLQNLFLAPSQIFFSRWSEESLGSLNEF